MYREGILNIFSAAPQGIDVKISQAAGATESSTRGGGRWEVVPNIKPKRVIPPHILNNHELKFPENR